MTVRQTFLKAVYPAWMWWTRHVKTNTAILHHHETEPPVSFYSLSADRANGTAFDFLTLKGKKILIVNTASDCGYTAQYNELEALYQQHKNTLVVLAFPSNDFGMQEKADDKSIALFCEINYRITFPIMKKSVVSPLPEQAPVYQWLTNPRLNGWNKKVPSWNFAKYLVNEQGMLTHYFGPSVSPISDEVANALK